MLVKEITYTDYDGNERKERFYFNFTKAELVQWDAKSPGGLKNHLEKMVSERDIKKIFETFEEIILAAYGVKSEDGKRFIKSKEISEEFKQTEAYSILFMELIKDETSMANFINATIPQV